VTDHPVVVRESKMGRIVFALIAAWACWFAIDVVRIGDQVTSKQWQYLMEVPLGKWLWLILFGVSGVITLTGLAMHAYRIAAVGLSLIGVACLLIAGFYLVAPLIDPGLLTLGYNPWAFPAGAAFFCAALNWTGATWF